MGSSAGRTEPDTCTECGDWFDNLDQGRCAECTHTDTMQALAAHDHG